MNYHYWVNKLELLPHPEGGFYKETYRSVEMIPEDTLQGFHSARNICTAIYFLMSSGKISAFHRILSDELWFFHSGSSLLIHQLDNKIGLQTHRLGLDFEKGDRPQITIPAYSWFGSEVEDYDSFSLVSCTVAPGFDFMDFEMGDREKLVKEYPKHQAVIERLTY